MSRTCIFASLLLAAALVVVSAGDDGDVLVLDADNFDREVQRHTTGDKALLVEFYAPWCGHCKSLEPKYKEAASKLMRLDPPLRIAKFDADEAKNKDIASKHGVSGFPTLKVFKDEGKTVLEYDGPREADGIVEYVKGAQGPVMTEVKTEAEVRAQLATNERVALFFGKEPRDASRAFTAFKAAAAKVKPDFTMLASFEPSVGAAFSLDAPAIVVFASYKQEKAAGEKGERLEHLKEGLTDEAKIRDFLYNFGKPLVAVPAEGADAKLLSKSTLPTLYMVVPGKDANRRNMYRNRMTKVAAKYAGRLAFAVADADKDGRSLVDEYGLSTAKLPTLIVKGTDSGKHRFDKIDEESLKFKAATITAFADDFLGGKVDKYLKSEALPADPTDDEPVQVVVGKNFNDVVLDKSKNVLLEMYAPWCGHCKTLEPEYKKAAKKLRKLAAKSPEKYGNIVLAKMDATANDSPHPELQARGYPTIKFVTAGSNKVVDFSGERKANDIVEWVKKEAAKY